MEKLPPQRSWIEGREGSVNEGCSYALQFWEACPGTAILIDLAEALPSIE
jgi:hypothetical protein